ncbi:MAG TPA: chemotaxis protein CheB, partial [Anseongella sp.]|nr:chemotaxis protein CheB [Anseongella sp.]
MIAVGASAGGLQALMELSAQLKEEMDAAVFVVLHLSGTAVGERLIQRVQKETPFRCKFAEHGEVMQRGHMYVAVPNYHLIVKKDTILLGN